MEIDKKWLKGSKINMWIAFCIAFALVIFGVINYEKMSYKATYFRNRKIETEKMIGRRFNNEHGTNR